ncbi:protein MGARP [Podarcis muralis]
MHLCSFAWRPLARRLTQGAAPFVRGHAPFRQMSSGSVPGSSGENFIYYLLVAGAAAAGGFLAYRTVTSDKSRYNERISDMQQRTVAEWKPKPWPPQSLENDETEANETTDASEEVKDAVEEETAAVTTGESEVQNEKHTESAEAQREDESPVEEASSGVQEEQDAPSSSEAAQTQG